MTDVYETIMQKSKIKSRAIELKKNTPLEVEDIEWSIRGLAWLTEQTMRSAERFFQHLMSNLLTYNVELITKSKLVPTETGFRLELEVEIPDDTVIYYAYRLNELVKLLNKKRQSIRISKYIRESRRGLEEIGSKGN